MDKFYNEILSNKSDTLRKREFVNLVFDSNLYYQDGIYRTPTMLGVLSHNHLIMKEKGISLKSCGCRVKFLNLEDVYS